MIPVGLVMLRFKTWQCKIGKLVPMESSRLQPFHSRQVLISNLFFTRKMWFPIGRVGFILKHINTHMFWTYMGEYFIQILHYLSWNRPWESSYQINRDIVYRTIRNTIECSKDRYIRIRSSHHSERFAPQCLYTETQSIHSEF